jgi:two-component system response regulator HydG
MRNESVLIIDDDKIVRDSLETLLKIEGFDVRCCDSGPSAVRLLQTMSFDIILTDYRLPHMNGDEAAKLLRYHYPDIYIIGMSIADMGTAFYMAGADAFIDKQRLVSELSTLLDARKLADGEKKITW